MCRKVLLLVLLTALLAAAKSDYQVIQEGVELIVVEGPGAGSSMRHPEVLSEQLYKRQNRIVETYNGFYFEDEGIVGDMKVMFTLEADGAVSGCIPVENTTGSPELARAVCDEILTWTLPPIPEAEFQGWVTVTVPYMFSPPKQPIVIELSPGAEEPGEEGD
jgi:hypothetical protein